MEDLEDSRAQPLEKWHRTLVEMTGCVEQAFRASGRSAEAAIADAATAVIAIYETYRGNLVYIPFSKAAQTELTHARIFSEFTGNNVDELSRRHEMSIQTIYKIIKKQRQMRRSAGQPESGGDE